MQFCSGMTRTSEAAATKTGGLQSEIATEFCGCLGDSEETVCRGIDAHCLIDAMEREWVLWCDFPPVALLDKGQLVWCIAIDLVCAAEDEWCVGTMLTSCFK